MTKNEALKLALEALELLIDTGQTFGALDYGDNAIAAIKQALAAQRKPLTDEQILADETLRYHFGLNGGAGPVSKKGKKVVEAIEAAHGIKENNT